MVMNKNDLTYKIIGCAMEVHNTLGNGFQEVIYQRALESEFNRIKIPFVREIDMQIYYKDDNIGTRRVDFLVDNSIIVEIKALTNLEPVHLAQALNYLVVYRVNLGLLINFGSTSLQYKRLINGKLNP